MRPACPLGLRVADALKDKNFKMPRWDCSEQEEGDVVCLSCAARKFIYESQNMVLNLLEGFVMRAVPWLKLYASCAISGFGHQPDGK